MIVIGQNLWVNIYHEEWDTRIESISLSYDDGYLISGRQEWSYAKYNWVTKTDINGEVLWNKMIGNGINSIYLLDMVMNETGSLYLCGGTKIHDPEGDPLIMKLNACGEKEWCKIISSPNNGNTAHKVCYTNDGGCAVTLYSIGENMIDDRICLAKFSSPGEMEWMECYNSQDSLMANETDTHLLCTPDNGFLISGWCYYTAPQGGAWLEPYFIKTDSLGNFEWESFPLSENGIEGGQAWQTFMNPDSNFYYSSISHHHRELPEDAAPALLKMDLSGNLVGIYDLANPGIVGKLFRSQFINDSVLAGSASWGDPDINQPMAVLMDTLGTIKSEQELLDNSYMSYIRYTKDEKLLYYTQMLDPTDDKYDAYLFKLNQDLSNAPVNMQTFTYDSLCPYQIASDTISQDDCGLIVGLDEIEPEPEPDQNSILVYPNPAVSVISYQLPVISDDKALKNKNIVEFWDLFGRKVEAMEVPPGQTELKSDVSGWPPGIYISILRNDRKILARRKFVVAR